MEITPSFMLSRDAGSVPVRERILIVDDELRIRDAYRQLLGGEHRDVDVAATGRDAMQKLGRRDVDVVLLDLNLPDLHGTQLMAWMERECLATSVVVFSAERTIDAAISALRRGACEFLRKPAEPDDVRRTIDQALERRRLKREHAIMTARLEQSERLHRFLVEHSPDIIYTLDDAGHFVFINHRIESLLGYRREDLIGEHFSTIVHEEDLDAGRHAFAERRIGERATNNHEIRLRCKPAGVRHFENRTIVAILSASGIYETLGEKVTGRFLGTSGVLRDITDRKRAEETIAFQAFHDLLTGLPNRVLFRDRLELALKQAQRRGQKLAVLYLDLDRFKLINDTFGHAEGDELLKAFAQRVRQCLRATDTMSRQGGDEFSILLPDIASRDDAATIAEKIVAALREPFRVGGQSFRATVSIGIALYPDDAQMPELLLRNADIAMYQIKVRGKNGFIAYAPEMSTRHEARLDLDNEFRLALERRQFELHYQPQIRVATGEVIGVEALVRWRHPQRGLLAPNNFVWIAEESGQIFQLSDWVLGEACRQLAEWGEAGLGVLKVAVNISAVEFERSDFVDRVLAPIRRYALVPEQIEVEITESLLMNDAEKVIDKVRRLREVGVQVSIDDFGTQYSSLNYLRRFPVNTVKIDQSFVRDLGIDDGVSPVISAIVGIARGFGLHVLAEGVENAVQRDLLKTLGCTEMQGFFFSRPVPAADVAAFVQARRP